MRGYIKSYITLIGNIPKHAFKTLTNYNIYIVFDFFKKNRNLQSHEVVSSNLVQFCLKKNRCREFVLDLGIARIKF